MFPCEYVQPGASIDYKNTGNELIPGFMPIVLGDLVGIVSHDIPPGEIGVVYTEGVFRMPSGSATLAVGAKVDWDDTAKAVVAAASGPSIGWVIAPTVGDGNALVKLVQ